MNHTFADYITEGWFIVYMDDLLIYSSTLEEHHHHQQLILQRLHNTNLFLKISKCTFDATKIEYLGMIIQKQKVEMDPVKVQGISAWPTPTNVKDIKAFLGFCNFYCCFISHFATIAKPLTQLMRKDVPWTWGPMQKKAFEALKCAFTEGPVLAHWDPD